MKIEREQIIKNVEESVKTNPSVFALWFEGADSTGTVDQYSDIDFWLDVQDGEESKIFDKIEQSLSILGKLDFAYQLEHPHPQIKHKIFHLQNTPDSLLLDICIQSHSRKFEFVKGASDEPLIIFNRGGVRFKEFNEAEFKNELSNRIYHIKNTFAQQSRVLTKIQRGEFLEGMMYYSKWILMPLVELLRIKYAPAKHDYYFKHISKDLPKTIVEQLEYLAKVQSVEEMQEKIGIASKIFYDTLKETEKEFTDKPKT